MLYGYDEADNEELVVTADAREAVTASQQQAPQVVPSTALTALQAILAALDARVRGAGGQHLLLSMLDAGMQFLWPDGFRHQTFPTFEPDESLASECAGIQNTPGNAGVTREAIIHYLNMNCTASCRQKSPSMCFAQTLNTSNCHPRPLIIDINNCFHDNICL